MYVKRLFFSISLIVLIFDGILICINHIYLSNIFLFLLLINTLLTMIEKKNNFQ
jgi:hypothetical protein